MPYEQTPEKNRKDSSTEGKDQQSGEDFSFLQETIKPKTVSRKQIFAQLARIAIYGAIFGLFACCGFFALKPWAETAFHKDTEKVTIEAGEEEVPEETDVVSEEAVVTPELTETDYQKMLQKLGGIAQEAEKCIVSVRPVDADAWADEKSAEKGVTGVIAADNGRELLIFSDNGVCADVTEWTVTFSDNSRQKATLKKQDKNRRLAVFSVDRAALKGDTLNTVHVAAFGNYNNVSRGETVIALGNMYHCEDGVSYGIVSSKATEDVFADGQNSVISTDIPLAEDGTGVLINLKGEVLGLIRDRAGTTQDTHMANALAISDLKSVMELMLNGQSVPYIGVNGVTVTREIAETHGIPEGLYVTQVHADSPAMAAGIQNGDVILEMKDSIVTGSAAFEKIVTECQTGETVVLRGQRRGTGGYVDVDFKVTVGSRE